MRSMRMPTRVAAFGLSAVACIILPMRVNWKKAAKASMIATVPARTTSCCGSTRMLPIKIGSAR